MRTGAGKWWEPPKGRFDIHFNFSIRSWVVGVEVQTTYYEEFHPKYRHKVDTHEIWFNLLPLAIVVRVNFKSESEGEYPYDIEEDEDELPAA